MQKIEIKTSKSSYILKKINLNCGVFTLFMNINYINVVVVEIDLQGVTMYSADKVCGAFL